MNKKIRILVADDHDLIRRGVVQILREVEPACSVCETRNWDEPLDAARANKDLSLAIINMRMPGMGGMDGLQALLQQEQTLLLNLIAAS